ncbi:syntaxin-binding protein 4-like isoform X2 [Ambystoma mexicanum]|uniref:syntaxin-binding protein 4-like isoform X2 n=1 Tax=Ambystoma mexicanum TaxID=8296 RepID=UPI0037E7BCE1
MSYLKPFGKQLERFDGLSLIYWTLMGPYGMDRTVYCMEFTGCGNGLGIKVIGGIREFLGEEYGVYVKRILPGGIAYSDGRLQPGDQILEVNGDSLLGVSNERAVDILRAASATSHMRLLIARDDDARREFAELMEKFGCHSDSGSSRSSPTMYSGGRYLESTSSESSSRCPSPQLMSPANCYGPFPGSAGLSPHSSCTNIASDSGIQNISIAKSGSLGLMICGGSNRLEGPMVYVQEIIPEGDCYRDGRLRPGDQLIAINRESLVGSTIEEAKRVLAKNRFRHENSTEVTFIPGRGRLPSTSLHNNLHLLPQRAVGNGLGPGRLKVHVRSPECRQDNHFPVSSPSPDICPPELTVSAPASSGFRGTHNSQQKITLDPHVRLREEKLELLLQYLGLDVAETKKRELQQSLVPDLQGTVAFGDILKVLRDIFEDDLEDAGLDIASLLFTHHQVATLLDTSAFHSLAFESLNCPESGVLEQLQQEVSDLRQEVCRLKTLLKEVESSKEATEDELQKLNQKMLGVQSENQTMQSKLQMAEIVQRQAHSAERDYEEVVHLLEAEIAELKSKLVEKRATGALEVGSPDVKRRLSLMDDQLRKTEVSRKRLEISNKKLLRFAQNVHTLLTTPHLLADEKRACIQQEDGISAGALGLSLPSSELIEMLASEASAMLQLKDDSPHSAEGPPGKEDGILNHLDIPQQKSFCPSSLCRPLLPGRGDEKLVTAKESSLKPT